MELKEVKAKIGSVKNISDITGALETFSALKMKKTQKRFSKSKPFAEEMAKMLNNMKKALREGKSVFLEERPVTDILVCVIASDRGFCGSFNSNALRLADKTIVELRKEGNVEILPIGKKTVSHYLKNEKIRYSFSGVGDYWRFSQTKEISDFLISSFLSNKYQKIYIVYTHFYSSFIQKPTAIQLFPVRNETIEEFLQGSTGEDVNKEYILEPSPEVILDEIIPVFVQYLIYQFILSANTSEHSARMMAMRNASDNAKGLLENLRLAYNKARQAQITSEVSEISSTKEAMG
ncbi:MAG TPA: ATP synthase F1 subunit gamma [Candidatus Pacearchaeota archaeon]|jgi:F-type H+-transporting ATPase subunit gamma|nr:ATP synthase F1 subunit gamma [Candidatus Pacearchaeota archaeon]